MITILPRGRKQDGWDEKLKETSIDLIWWAIDNRWTIAWVIILSVLGANVLEWVRR